MTVHPATPTGTPMSAASLAREVAELERIAGLLRRRAELRSEIDAYGAAWSLTPIRPSEIIAAVAAKHAIRAADITGPDRTHRIAVARQEAMWLLRDQIKADGSHRFSLPRIGEILGGRDHTTIHHGIARHTERMTGLGLSGGGPWPSALGAEGLARSTGIDQKSSIDSRVFPSQPSGETGPNSPSSPQPHCDLERKS